MISNFTTQYLPPLLLAVIVVLAGLLLLFGLSRRGVGRRLWGAVVRYRGALGFLFAVVLFVVAFVTYLVRLQVTQNLISYRDTTFDTGTNLVTQRYLPLSVLTHTVVPVPPPETPNPGVADTRTETVVRNNMAASTNVIIVRPGQEYVFSVTAESRGDTSASAQVRLLWFGPALNLIAFEDRPQWQADPAVRYAPDAETQRVNNQSFHSERFRVPEGATRLQLEVRNMGNNELSLRKLLISQIGVYVEPHPNATSGSIAFSFDWETAMGGAVHSKGDENHDVAGAEQHGLEMRQGADWLNNLFATNHISATFYATGYNLLDGNIGHSTFSENPTYQWAAPKNGWGSEYWLTHPWFSDDPFGTYQRDPAWYFGDQTRALLAAGHEIAPHTFAHIYVRGSNPQELATDLDEWLKYAKAAGVRPPTTFAFPWRSSNSLNKDFYDVFYSRGIRAVTRIYAPDMKDQYTLGNAVVYTDIKQAQIYPDMAVMPDFLLGSPSANAGEEAGGGAISREQGLNVIAETVARRGTTSFWQHPEQLAEDPAFNVVRQAWTDVAGAAARERDNGRLWIATVAEITAYQRDVMSVTATLQPPGITGGKWRIEVRNDSGRQLQGVTLTLPGEAATADDQPGTIQSVLHPKDGETRLGAAGKFEGPSRQIVLSVLAPGTTSIEVEWVKGQEPLQ